MPQSILHSLFLLGNDPEEMLHGLLHLARRLLNAFMLGEVAEYIIEEYVLLRRVRVCYLRYARARPIAYA